MAVRQAAPTPLGLPTLSEVYKMDARSSASFGGETKLSATWSSASGVLTRGPKILQRVEDAFFALGGHLGGETPGNNEYLPSECSRI